MLELIARDPQAFILNQGRASVSLDGERGIKELRALYEYLQARILENIESLDTLRASPEMEIFHEVEHDESVIERVTAAQREEREKEIASLQAKAEPVAEEARELAGEVPFKSVKRLSKISMLTRRRATRINHAAGDAHLVPRFQKTQ